jgi:hypothetical protein
MKLYGRDKKVKGAHWKVDYHCYRNHRKLGNWWEEICKPIPRSTLKIQLLKSCLRIPYEEDM